MSDSPLPILGLTMGDAAGVGPEVIAGCWDDPRVHATCRRVVIGHPQVMERAIELRAADCQIEVVSNISEIKPDKFVPGTMYCLSMGDDLLIGEAGGQYDFRTGEAAYQAVCQATALALAGEIDGIVTAPLSKASLHAAGRAYPGHTELLAELCATPEFAMMLYMPPGVANSSPAGLGVAHVTLHTSLRSIFDLITIDAIVEKCQLIADMMRRLGVESPRIGVAALNPHGGEEGLFGKEEIEIIRPAVERAQSLGLDVEGPFPSDTLMIAARQGRFDGVVVQYHDQGHIAIKLLAMHSAVNVTLGLPIVRTSVAHGTAFDLAWKGTAETSGMVAAIETAAKLAAGYTHTTS